jgi:uracil-DNA glycosylase family protein
MPPRPAKHSLGVPLAKPVDEIPEGTLATLRRKARDCHACPLWRYGTQTVFGQGPATARVMLIGEQPGLYEDREGVPFVGPAGQLLDRAMGEAGLDRSTLYLTNAVKHFKYETRGTAKLHKRANAAEQAACRMWLAAELLRVQPKLVVGLGAMAAQTMFGNTFRITRERGAWRPLGEDVRGLATWHPSAVLRMPEEERRHQAFAELVADLRAVAEAAQGLE